MSGITHPKPSNMAAFEREASQYLDKLEGPQKVLMAAAEKKVHDYAQFAMNSGNLPLMNGYDPLKEEDKNLALNLFVFNIKWLESNHLDQIKIGDQTLKATLHELCQFCVSEAIAERDGTKKIPQRPTRSVSVPTELAPSTSKTKPLSPPKSPRKNFFSRKSRGRAGTEPIKPSGPLQFVMPKAKLSLNETIVAVEGAFIKLQSKNQKKILQWLRSEGEEFPIAIEGPMQKIQVKAITDMCKELSMEDRNQLLKKIASSSEEKR